MADPAKSRQPVRDLSGTISVSGTCSICHRYTSCAVGISDEEDAIMAFREQHYDEQDETSERHFFKGEPTVTKFPAREQQTREPDPALKSLARSARDRSNRAKLAIVPGK